MAITFRLQKTKYNQTVLSGYGAFKSGGRWNKLGTPLIYTSSTSSLAILESQVHIDKRLLSSIPGQSIIALEIPDECIHQFERKDLPNGWASIPVNESTQLFLAPWLEAGNKLAFSVPSVVNPNENNILINPLHPHINRVKIQATLSFVFDHRLLW